MGDAQSAQREGKKDEAAEEESGKVDDAQAEQSSDNKLFKNNVQIHEINAKSGISIAEVNGLCEDEVAADAVLSPDDEISETEIPLEDEEEEEAPIDLERNENETSNEVVVAEDVPLEMTEMDGKKNDINDGFRKFFSNIGLRLSIKRGSTDLLKDLPNETNNEEQCDEEPAEIVVKETESKTPEQNKDANAAQGNHDNDSTTGPTMTDLTPEDAVENAEEKATEAREEAGSDDAGETTPPDVQEAEQEVTPEGELQDSPEKGGVVSPIKKFFTTGIFSGLRKKRKPAEEETNEKEMVDMGKKDGEETEEEQQLDKEQIDPGVEASADEAEHKENGLKQEIVSTTSPETTDEGKSSTTDPSTDIVPEPDTANTREKVPSSPLKRLLSGSSFRRLSKKPRSRRSSESRLSDSGEHATDQLMSSTESAENQKEEAPVPPQSSEAAEEEDSAWASFKKLLTPKKRRRAPSFGNKDTDTPAAADKPKSSEGEQVSDQSTDEDKKRKDSSHSWEAVLCGSGKKRSRKTSDSEDETPPNDNDNKQESSSERKNSLVSSPRVRTDGEGPTTWITFRRLVTPKRKAKEEDESKDIVQSDSEVSQDESSFSIKKLLPGRKKRKSTEKQDHVSSDEADKDVPSGDEDSETPAVVPLSEFDTPESMVQIQTQAEIENNVGKESDYDVPEDLQELPEPVLPDNGAQTEGKTLEESEVKIKATTTAKPAKDEELDDDSDEISKHQQLSDITEEGIITETMATPASVNEETGKDDTIAEDLVEITSEAITAPEPASVTTLADETEMISAVSQLSSESSKTSGNTTPVPAEYEVMETDALLQQVVETITTTPETVPVTSSNTKSENIVSSVLHQIFKTFVKEDKAAAVLEIHTKSEAATITTGDAVKELDEVKELAATAQTEIMPEVNETGPTEFLPEAFEKIETAEVTVGEVQVVPPESEASAEPVLEKTTPDESSIIEAPQDEMENQRMEAASLEVEEEAETQNVESEKVDELARDESARAQASKLDSDEEIEQLPEQEVKSVDIPPTETTIYEAERMVSDFDIPSKAAETDQIQDPEVLPTDVEDTAIEASAVEEIFMSVDEGSVSLSRNEGTIEQVDAPETDDLVPNIKESLEPIDSSAAEPIEEPEELKTEQTTLFNTEEPQQEMEISIEPENKTILEDAAKNELVLEAIQAPETHLDNGDGQLRHKEVELEDVLVADGLKEESIPLTEDSIEPLKAEDDAAKNESAQEPEVFDTLQASQDSSVDNCLLPEEDKAKDIPPESVMDEEKQETSVQPDEVKELEEQPSTVVDTGIETSTEDFFVSVDEGSVSLSAREVTLQQIDESKETQEEEELQTLQPSVFSQLSSFLTFGKVTTKDIPVTDETQNETEVEAQEKLQDEESHTGNVEEAEVLPSEVKDSVKVSTFDEPVVTESVDEDIAVEESLEPMESFKAEQFEKHEDVQAVQTSLIDTEGPQEEELVKEDVENVNVQEPEMLPSIEETLIEKEESVHVPEVKESIEEIRATVLSSGESLEPVDLSITDVQEQEEPQPVQASLINTEGPQEEELVDEDVEKVQEPEMLPSVVETEETLIEKEEAVPVEPMDLSKTDVQVQEEPQQVQETCSLLPLEKIAEGVPAVETITEEIQKEAEVRANELGKTEVEADTSDSVQEAEDLPSTERDNVQETVSEESEIIVVTEASDSMKKQGAPTIPTEPSPEPVDVSETEGEKDREVLNTEEASLLDSEEGSLLLEKVRDEPQQETEARDEEPEVSLLDVEDTVKEVRVEQLEQPQVVPQEPEVLQSDVEVVEKEIEKETEKVHVQEEPEPLKTVEALPLDSEVCSLAGLKTTPEMATDELTPITEFVREPKEPPPSLEDTDQDTSNEGDTIQPAVVVESIDRDSAIVSLAEKSPEVVDVARSEDKQEPEEVHIEQEEIPEEADVEQEAEPEEVNLQKEAEPEEVHLEQEAETEPKAQSLQLLENVMSEEIPAAEKVTDEPQEETKVLDEPERELLSGAVTADYAQEKEEIPASVKDTDLDTSAEEAVTSIVEVFETTPHTVQSPEAVDVSGIRDVQEPEVFNTTPLEGELLLDKVIPENKSAVEIIIDELQKELDIRVEPQEIPQVEADTCGTEQEAQPDPKASDLTFENVISEDVETVESVTDESHKDITDTIKPVEELPALPDEAFESEIQEPEESPSNMEDVDRETFDEDTTIDMLVATGSIIESSAEIPAQEENALITEQAQVQDEIPTVQESLESPPQLEKALPEDKLAEETVMEEPLNEIYYSIELHDQQPVVGETSENVQETDTLPSSEIQETPTEDDRTTHVPEEEEGKDEAETPTPTTEGSPETMDASEKEAVREPEVLNTTQEDEDVPEVETSTDEPTEEKEVRYEELEVLDVGDTARDSMTEEGVSTDVDVVTEEPEQGSEQKPVIEESLKPGGAQISPSLEPQIEQMSSEDNHIVETVSDEHIQQTEVKVEALEEQPFEVTQTENDQEAELPPTDGEGYMKETETEGYISVSEEDAVEQPQEQIQQEDVSKPDLDNIVTAITDHIQSDVMAQLDHDIDVTEAPETESYQQVQVELKGLTPEVAKELATRPQDHVASVDEESNNSQVLENTTISEEIQAPSVDDVAVIDESKHEVPLSVVQVTVEEEKESDEISTKAASLMHAIVPDVVTCFFKKVSATVRDVLPERTSDSAQPGLDSDELAEAGEQEIQSVECEDDQQVQEQVVDTDIKSMETIVEKMPEIEETEMKEAAEVCATIQEEDILSEHPDIEEGVTQEETPMTIEDDVHVKENLPETVSESVIEQHVVTQPDDVGEVCELPESESDQKEHQEIIDAAAGTLKELEDEPPAVINEDLATLQQMSEDVDQTLLLKETKAEEVKSAEEVKPLPEESDVKTVHEPEQSTKSAQSPLAMPSDTGLVVPQNTRFISSTGNFESPSSLSLEFKLNIQFGQAKAQPPPPPTAESMKKKDVSEVGVQAEVPPKPVEPTTAMQQGEDQKNIDPAVVKDQPLDTASSVLTLASTARAVTTTHPVQMNFGHLSMEAVEPVTTPQLPQPSTPEGAEPLIEKDVAEIKIQEMESEEQATQRAEGQNQTEIIEGQDQLVEISKPLLLQGPTKEESEILEVATHAAESEEQVSKVPEELLEQLDALTVEKTDVKDQPTEIRTAEPEAALESTEKAVITTQPEVTDDGICASETEEPVAEVEGSPHLQNDVIEQLTSTDPANETQRGESQTEPSEVNVYQTEIKEQVKDFFEEASAVIITQPVLWDLAMCTLETVEPEPKELAPSLQISGTAEASGEDVSKEADNQAEPEEPSNSAEGVVLMTHPVLLDISLQESEIGEPLPITEEIELSKMTDVLEVGVKAEEEAVDLTQGAVDVQPTIITEPVLPSDFTEAEILEVALQENEAAQQESKAPASSSAEMESAKALTATEVSNDIEEPLTPTQTAEEQKETELPEIDVQETEITRPEEQESATEITERAVITTHPTLLDIARHATQTVDPVENAPESPTTTSAEIEPLKETDVLESDIKTKEEESQKQSEVSETSLQVTEITKPEVNFDLSQVAVITTQPVLLDDSLYAIKTVELEVEDAENVEENPMEKVTASIQSTETISPVSQTEKDEEFLSVQETKVTKEHVHNQEEENDQDVWLDAEEGDYTQEETEMSFVEVEEHLESVEETMPEEEEARFEEEVVIDPDVHTEEEEVQKEEYKTGEVCEIESEGEGEGEDFAIALEHQEYATASVTTVEWD